MIKDAYSPYKIIHHLDKIQQLKNGIQTTPLQVQIIPSNKCNHSCVFCAYRLKGNPSNQIFDDNDMLSYEKVIEILDNCVEMDIKAVHYTGGGEVLVHPDHYKMFEETFKRNIELALVTNGMALKEKTCDLLGDSSWVRVSIDCSKPKTYSLMRKIDERMFNKTINNVKNLVKYKRESILGVGFVVNRENYDEIYESAKMFKDIGVDNFRISAAFTPMGYNYFNNIYDKSVELSKLAVELSDENFTVFNMFDDRVKDMFGEVQDYKFCGIKELLAYIGADYNVYTCCTLAYNNKGLIGDIRNRSFKALWEGKDKQNAFYSHDAEKLCQNPCMYKGKNHFINYCIKDDAQHINFI